MEGVGLKKSMYNGGSRIDKINIMEGVGLKKSMYNGGSRIEKINV
jgi:hypothetical protein